MKKIIKILFVFLYLIICFVSLNLVLVKAENNVDITTSNVLDDLISMEKDNVSNSSNSTSLFITMSQYYDSTNNLRSYLYLNIPEYGIDFIDELYVDISLSVQDSNYEITENYLPYKLSYVNNYNTWYKFEIINLTNIYDTTRRYHIRDIYVVTSKDYDEINCIDLSIDEVFIFNGIKNNSIEVFHQEIDTITITDKLVVDICYGDFTTNKLLFYDGYFNLLNEKDIYTDSWYILFNTDKKIDELYEIELTYTQIDYKIYSTSYGISPNSTITESLLIDMKNGNAGSIYPDQFEDGKSYFTYRDSKTDIIEPGKNKVSYVDKGWFGKYKTYYEEKDNIIDLRKLNLEHGEKFIFKDYSNDYTWAVNFKNTERFFEKWADAQFPIAMNLTGSSMKDISILRLKFMSDGVVKNCYAIDNPTSDFIGDSEDVVTDLEKAINRIKEILSLILGLIPLIIILSFIPSLIPLFIEFFKILINFISFPFKFISKLFKRKK